MEILFGLFGLAIAGWFLIAPILGVLAYLKLDTLQQEIAQLRTQLKRQSFDPESPSVQQEQAPTQVKAPPIKTSRTPPPEPPTRPVSKPRPVVAPSVESTPSTTGPDWERLIAANWMIWAGGLALALGALFLVRVTIEAGYFGPEVRTSVAALLGLVMIGVSWRARSWTLVKDGQGAVIHLPSILAGAGVIALYGSCLAAGVLYGLLNPLIILAGFVITSFIAVLLALLFGPVLAAIGLIGAYVSPFFTGADGGSPLILLPYAGAVTAAGLLLISWRSWRFMTWITLLGGLLWGVVGLSATGDAAAWAVPSYAIALIVIATYFAWEYATKPLTIIDTPEQIAQELGDRGEILITAYLFWIGSGCILALSMLHHQVVNYAIAGMSIYAGLGLLTAWRREGMSLLAPLSAIVVMTTLAFWPNWSPSHTALNLAVSIGFGVVGMILFPRLVVKTPVAATSALTPPVGLFIAFWRGGDFEKSLFWGLGGLAIALVMISVLEGMRRSKEGFESQSGAAASYALGAALCIAVSPFLVASELWLGTGVAVAAAALAIVHVRFDFPLLRQSGVLTSAIAVLLLIRPGMLSSADISPTPIFNELTASYGLAIVALVVGGILLLNKKNFANAYFSAAGILCFALIGLLIRHWAGNGDLTGPFGGYAEASGYAIAYIGAALSLVWRLGDRGNVLFRLAEYAAATIGIVAIFAAFSAMDWDEAPGFPVLNLLFVAIAMPALLLGAVAHVLRRKSRKLEAELFGLVAILTGLVWATAEIRRLFTGPYLSGAGLSELSGNEMWAYSAIWLAFAIGLLAWGVRRGLASVRYASLGLLILTIGKVFLFDLSTTEGVWRAVSFIGLGVTLLGVALFYQRFVFRLSPQGEPAEGVAS